MNRLSCFRFAILLFVPMLILSCTSEKETEKQASLLGKWEMESAFRNEKLTTTLENTYFEFLENGTLNSNLPLSSSSREFSTSYTFKNNQISCTVGESEYLFDVQSLSDSLILKTDLMSTAFTFIMTQKAVTESENEVTK